jgi:DNA-binding SARP family transcriptional activator
MAVNGVRAAMADAGCIAVDANRVWWAAGSLGSDFVDLQVRQRRLRNVSGYARLRLAMEALDAVGDEVFLDGARSRWAIEQRASWLQLVLDTKHAAAEAAYEVSDYGMAHRFVSQVLSQDPYRERAWRLAMRIASAVGDNDRVLSLYLQCEKALTDVPAEPAGPTRRLLESLRA